MAKKVCAVCQKDMGFPTPKVQLKDAKVCMSCWQSAGYKNSVKDLINAKQMTIADLGKNKLRKQECNEVRDIFIPTETFSMLIQFSDTTRSFKVAGSWGGFKKSQIYSYDDMVSYKLEIPTITQQKSGLGGAVAGGILFGGIGAIVGSNVGKGEKVTSHGIETLCITLTTGATLTATSQIMWPKKRQELSSKLDLICSKNKKRNQKRDILGNSIADEIKKYKDLLDTGVITKAEFEAKKHQLLNL